MEYDSLTQSVEPSLLEQSLEEILADSEELRELVMTDVQYRDFRLRSAKEVIIRDVKSSYPDIMGNDSEDGFEYLLNGLEESMILYWGIESAVRQYWQRDPDLVMNGSLEGLPDCVQDIFRPVLIIPTTENRTLVDREQGRIPIPEDIAGKLEISKRLFSASVLRNELEKINLERQALGFEAVDINNPEETLGGFLTISQIQKYRRNGDRGFFEQQHHMVAVHQGSAENVGDEIQIPITTVTHLYMHVNYCKTALRLMQRIEEMNNADNYSTIDDFTNSLSPAVALIYRQAQIEYAQNAQSANAIRNSYARSFRDDEIQARFESIRSQVASETRDNRLQKILQKSDLTESDRAYLRTLIPEDYRPGLRQIVSGEVEKDDSLAAYLAPHRFGQLVPDVHYSRRISFGDLPEDLLVQLFEDALESDPDDVDSNFEHLQDRIATEYIHHIVGPDKYDLESFRTNTPRDVIAARYDAENEFLEKGIIPILQEYGIDLGEFSQIYDQIHIQFSRWFSFGLYNVINDYENTGVNFLEYDLALLRGCLPENLKPQVEELAQRCYEEGLKYHNYELSQLINLEDSFGEKYRVSGVSELAFSLLKDLENGRKIGVTFDMQDTDGLLSAATLNSIIFALTGQYPETFTGNDGSGHSLTLRSLIDLSQRGVSRILVADRGSGELDAEVIKKFFDGIESPKDLLNYANEYSEEIGNQSVRCINHLVRSINRKLKKNPHYNWRGDALDLANSYPNLVNLSAYIQGVENVQLSIIDHHILSDKMQKVLEDFDDNIDFINPRSTSSQNEIMEYSAATICHQLAIEMGKLFPEFLLKDKDLKEKKTSVYKIVVAELKTHLEGIGERFDYTGDLREQLIQSHKKSKSITRSTARNHIKESINKSLEKLVQDGKLTFSEMLFFRANFFQRRYFDKVGNFVENTRPWVSISTLTDVMPVDNLWVRAIFQDVLTQSEIPFGYDRLKKVSASAIGRLSSSLLETSRTNAFVDGPSINAALRLRDSQTSLNEILMFFVNPVEQNKKVCAGRRAIKKARKKSLTISEQTRNVAEESYKKNHFKDGKYRESRIMVADISDVDSGARTGLAAQHLVGLSGHKQPAIVYKKMGNVCVASIRTPGSNVNFAELIEEMKNNGIVRSGGGHPFACGLSFDRNKLDDVISFLNRKLENYSVEEQDAVIIDLDQTELDSLNTLNLFELTKQATAHAEQLFEPFGLNVPRLAFTGTFKVQRISGTLRDKEDRKYMIVRLEDKNGNIQNVYVYDPFLQKQFSQEYSSKIIYSPVKLTFSWSQTLSPKPSGLGEVTTRRDGYVVSQPLLRIDGGVRSKITIKKIDSFCELEN